MKLLISKSYGEKKVFDNFSVDIEQGKILCILGPSGCGKTTLLRALAGLMEFDGEKDTPEKVGYIFQEPRLLPALTIEQNLRYAGGRVELIDEILKKTELFTCRNKRPKALSGGEKQRVAIARAFLSDAPMLLLDEPFSSLDTALKIRLSKVFASLWQEKKQTVVFVTHDIEEAFMLGHRILLLNGEGKTVADVALDGEVPRAYGGGDEIKQGLLKILLES